MNSSHVYATAFAGRLMITAAAALSLCAAAEELAGQETIEVSIVRPAAGEPLFGPVQVEVRVEAGGIVDSLELWVDGRKVGSRQVPPFEFTVDVGEENREHLFEAIARGSGGRIGRARLVSPPVHFDEIVELALQQLYVTVLDQGGRRVLGLPRQAFEVFDDGVLQDLVTFADGGIPFTATLLVDSSSSMHGEAIEAALGGARAFAEGMTENDEVKVVVHDARPRRVTDFHSDAGRIAEALAGAEAGGGTAVLDPLYAALLELEGRQGRRVIVLLSDGLDIHSVIRPDEVEALARVSQTLIYWVRLVSATEGSLARQSTASQPIVPLSAWRDQSGSRRIGNALERIVRRSGGRVSDVDSVEQVQSVFRDILRELREQYALGYYADPRRDDGSWRPVKISVKRPELRLRAREGYVDR